MQSHGSASDTHNINKVFHYSKNRWRDWEERGSETDGMEKRIELTDLYDWIKATNAQFLNEKQVTQS